MIPKLDSIIFDLDGTLWDSTATVARAWSAAGEKTDFVKAPVSKEDVESICGLPYDVIYQQLFPYLDDTQRSSLMQLCAEEELIQLKESGGQLYEGLEETLRYLHDKYRLFIVSNCQSGYIEAFMEYHRLQEYFEDIDCFGNAGRSKADNLRDIIQRNGLRSTAYVGDTQGDFNASRSNHIPFIFAAYGFGQIDGQPDAQIERITDLKGVL